MTYKWETEMERIKRFTKIPPRKKMDFLFRMHQLIAKTWTRKQKENFFKLRALR